MPQLEELIRDLQHVTEQGIHNFEAVRTAVQQLVAALAEGSSQTTNLPNLTCPSIIHAHCLLSEFWDYFGEYQKAAQILVPYDEAILKRLQQKDPKHYARLCVQFARIAYRAREFPQAKDWIEQSLAAYGSKGDPFGVALASLQAAKVFHRLLDFSRAREHVYQAVAVLTEWAMSTGSRVASYRVALAQPFLARLAFRQGCLQEAEAHIGQAQLVLQYTEDLIHQATVHDTWACIIRAKAQSDEDYRQAEGHLQRALELYQRAGHATYMARVHNNLGHTYCRMQRYEDAEQELQRALAANPQDLRTPVERLYFLARLYLQWEKWDKAEPSAREAIEEARRNKVPSIEAEASITLGQILVAHGSSDEQLREASNCAKWAQQLNRAPTGAIISLKTEIAANLLMAEIQCRHTPPDRETATTHYKKGVEALNHIQNCFLQVWAERVEQTIEKLDGAFHISPTVPNLSLPRYEQKLRFWLLMQAMRRAGLNKRGRVDRNRIAELLEVKRQTIEQWLREWRENRTGKQDFLDLNPQALEGLFAAFGLEREALPRPLDWTVLMGMKK